MASIACLTTSIGRFSARAISFIWFDCTCFRWSETICCASVFCGSNAFSCSSRHSRRSRAPTPMGSKSCTTASASSRSSCEYFPSCASSSIEAVRYPFSSRLPMMFSASSRTLSEQMVTLSCREMVGESGRRGQELLKRGPLGDLAFLGLASVPARVQVLIEKTSNVEFIERIGRLRFRHLLRFVLQEILVAVIVGGGRLFAQFFQDRIRHHLLIDHLAQFQAVQRQHADHLHQAGRQNLLLRNLEVKFESLPGHDGLLQLPFRASSSTGNDRPDTP